MKILVINTVLQLSFIALVDENGQDVKTFSFQNTSENLLPEIDRLLKKHKTTLSDLSAISVCVGPGSFTGIRVGVATAKAASVALKTPLVSFNAFDLFPKSKTCLTKANSGGVYIAEKGEIKFIDKNQTEKLKNKSVFAFEEERDYFKDFSKASFISLVEGSIDISKKLCEKKKFCSSNKLIPLYIQNSQAENELDASLKNAKIALASGADVTRLFEIEKECFTAPYSEQTLKKEIENKSKKIFVISVKNQIVGYILLCDLGKEIELERICIIKKYRSLGLGVKLASESFKHFNNAEKCFLEVNKKNKIAINLYSKLGFEVSGERKNYYGEGEDALLMTKLF